MVKSRWKGGLSNSQRRQIEERARNPIYRRARKFMREPVVDYAEGTGYMPKHKEYNVRSVRSLGESEYQDIKNKLSKGGRVYYKSGDKYVEYVKPKLSGRKGARQIEYTKGITTKTMQSHIDSAWNEAYSKAEKNYLAPRKALAVLIADEQLSVSRTHGGEKKYNGISWTKVELKNEGRTKPIRFNLRTNEYERIMRERRYGGDSSTHLLHWYENNMQGGEYIKYANHLSGLAKTFEAHNMIGEMQEVYEVLDRGNLAEMKKFYDDFCANELQNMPEDFFDYE